MALKQCAPGLDSVFVTIKAKNVYQQDELLVEITTLLNRLRYRVLAKSNIFYLLPQNQLDYFYDFVMRRKDDIKKSVTKDFGDFIESYSELLENEILEGTPDSNMEEMVRNLLRSIFIWVKLNTELLNNRRIAPESFSRYLCQIILPTNRYIFYAEKGFFVSYDLKSISVQFYREGSLSLTTIIDIIKLKFGLNRLKWSKGAKIEISGFPVVFAEHFLDTAKFIAIIFLNFLFLLLLLAKEKEFKFKRFVIYFSVAGVISIFVIIKITNDYPRSNLFKSVTNFFPYFSCVKVE